MTVQLYDRLKVCPEKKEVMVIVVELETKDPKVNGDHQEFLEQANLV
jgi:hypothetical protein